MLSTENPPSDPPCICEILELRSSDEKASDNLALKEVDLLKSGLDYNQHPIPHKFSIRDYVFGARNKDIKTNWPFSQKNLQLCLKHGVTDLLPPFQPLDLVRNQSFKRCAVETSLIVKESISNKDGEPSGPGYELVSASSGSAECNQKVAAGCVSINNSGSEGDKELPSTSTNQSRFEILSVPTSKSPCLELQDNIFLEDSAAKVEAAVPPASHKTENTFQPLVKKCRLIVKLSKVADLNTNEANTSNNCMVSETMSSIVCPVCKNFSSSSNTTLNAHIDQCLSGESTAKWRENSKEIKHRIKPRKTRLMVDIYATAQHCTLEELDRRNGTCWATNSSLPTQETEARAEEKDPRVSPSNLEDTGNGSAVYIDANGTKLRILSKFNDMVSVSKAQKDIESRKLEKACKGSKFLSTKKKKKKKKKHHMQKHLKLLKLVPHGKKFCSFKHHHNYENSGSPERKVSTEKCPEEFTTQCAKAHEQIKLSESGALGRWACSKRTSFTKKTNAKGDHHQSGCNVSQDLAVGSCQSSLCDTHSDGSCFLKTPDISKKLISYQENSLGRENSSSKHQVDDFMEHPSQRKRMGFSSLGLRVGSDGRRSLELSKQNKEQHWLDSSSTRDSCKDHPNFRGKNMSSFSHKRVEVITDPVKNPDGFAIRPEASSSCHAFLSKARRSTSLKKNLLSVCNSSAPASRSNLKRKCSVNSQVHFMSGLDEEAMMLPSELDVECDLNESQNRRERITDNISSGGESVLKSKKKRRAIMISEKGKALVSKSTQSRSDCCGDDMYKNLDSSTRVGSAMKDKFDDIESTGKHIETHCKDIGVESTSTVAIQGSIMSLSKCLNAETQELASLSDAQCHAQQPVGAYKGSFCEAEASLCPTMVGSLGDAQEIFSSNEVGHGTIGQNRHIGAEVDSKCGQGYYYLEVEPIPIPGPPGSYLPSPGNTGSEDLQGNSSVTTSRVQSSEDHEGLVDRDLSDSPASATSTISNSATEKSEPRPPEKLSAGHHAFQDQTRTGFSRASIDPGIENSAPVTVVANIGAERINPDEQKANVIISEKLPLSFKNDQPCCCSRKEGAFQYVALNYQESQLLRRRTIASLPLAGTGKQMNCDPSRRPSCLNSRSEILSLSNYPSWGPGKVVLPAMASYAARTPMKILADSEDKFPIRSDCGSACLSSNSVLRLMGKNLMVANKDEDVQMKLRKPQKNTMDEQPHPQFLTFSEAAPGNFQNEGYHFRNHEMSQGPILLGQNQHDVVDQHFDVKKSNGSQSHLKFRTPQAAPHASMVMFPAKNTTSSFMMPSENHEYLHRLNLASEHGPKSRLDIPLTYCSKKIVTGPGFQCRNADSPTNPANEVIIIDDFPETRADSERDAAYCEGMMRKQEISVATSIPGLCEYNTQQVNPLYSSQPWLSSPYAGSTVVDNVGIHLAASRMLNSSPMKWNCTQEGSLLHPSSLTTSSSFTGHPRSTLYYSPSSS